MEPTTITPMRIAVTGGSGRIEEGVALLSQGRAKKLFISGVPREVELAQFAAKGLPSDLSACCVVLGHEADSTRQNAQETARWMRTEGFRSLLLVTAAYHMPRSEIEFHAAEFRLRRRNSRAFANPIRLHTTPTRSGCAA